MNNALELIGLRKAYPEFVLDDINLTLPAGSIMGLIGENGAGKSTTIKLILNLLRRDAGEITVLGKDSKKEEMAVKEQLGVVFDQACFPDSFRPRDVETVLKRLYRGWDSQEYSQYLDRFELPGNKTVKEYSRGMKTKLSIAAALSHHARLLILDEPTGGLDPVVRDELLDVLLEYIQDDRNSVLISSHLITDLEKIADYIAFLHRGKLIFCENKEELLDRYGMINCTQAQFEELDKAAVLGRRKNQFGVEALVDRRRMKQGGPIERASIEDIMLYIIKGEKQ